MSVEHPFRRLLLATEHGEFDSGAEALAFALSQRCGLPLAGVLPILSNAEFEAEAPELAARADAGAAVHAQALQQAARAAGVALTLQVRRGPALDSEIVSEARASGADLIIVRRRGRRGFLARLLVGEMVGRVVALAPCSVLVAPRGAAMWSRRVLVGLDPQAPAPGAVACAARIAAACGLPLTLLAVADGPAQRAVAEAALSDQLASARALGAVAEARVQPGRPAVVLCEAARASGADLLVLGRHGTPMRGRGALGSTVHDVIGQAGCPVLVHVQPSSQAAA